MNRTELLNRLNELELSKGDYWLITGGAMGRQPFCPQFIHGS